MTDDLRVGHISCPPGQSARGRIVVGYQQDGMELALPVLVMNGARQGPTVYMGALIHGGEPSGAEVAEEEWDHVMSVNIKSPRRSPQPPSTWLAPEAAL